ncbi:MAG: hypothetical protein JXA82_08625 [Sedimentisphaerales bacterium]|nr:hypothetical protein [Sedimentisphaerales bacterium]
MKVSKSFLSLFVILTLTLACALQAEVRLPSVIGSNMVLQQQTEAPIWGWAEPGEKISVRGNWQWFDVTTWASKDGSWLVKLPTPGAGGPYTVTIKGANEIKLDNVLIGEVWVCSGQSNMQWTVKDSNNAQEEIAAAKYPNIRLFYVTRKVAQTPQNDCEGAWKECNPETIPGFSAAAYFFGRELHKELNIPIGLIHTSWGGTPAEAWTRRAILESDKDFMPIVERFDQAMENYPKAMEEYKQQVEEWRKQAEQAKAEGKNPPRYPGQPFGPDHPHSPAGLYNAMIAPLIPYAIQGAIWYQGESNAGRSYQYRTLFPAMIRNWRQDWGQGDFPFYFVQIAPYNGQTPEIREAQLIAYHTTPNTGMVVTMDIGNPTDIHPRNKQDVGKRLALWALSNTYGKEGIVYSGPLYKAYKIEGDKIRIMFDFIGSGLMAKDGPLTYFLIAEEDKDFVPAQAKIDGDTVVVWSDDIKNPVAVRYGWENGAEPNLFNKEGLPASPFRTDDRKGETYGRY